MQNAKIYFLFGNIKILKGSMISCKNYIPKFLIFCWRESLTKRPSPRLASIAAHLKNKKTNGVKGIVSCSQ